MILTTDFNGIVQCLTQKMHFTNQDNQTSLKFYIVFLCVAPILNCMSGRVVGKQATDMENYSHVAANIDFFLKNCQLGTCNPRTFLNHVSPTCP
jgi:hypothetical protein